MIVASMTYNPATGHYTIKVVYRYEETGEEVFLTRATHMDSYVAMHEIWNRYKFQPEVFDHEDPENWFVLTGDGTEYLRPDCLTLLECLEASMERPYANS